MEIGLYKIVGIIGLVLISWGVIKNDGYTENLFYVLGGIFMGVYSLYIGDVVFIALQIVFILSAIYAVYNYKKDVK